ncbi:hypothetical protein QQY79_01950 [Flavobacterium tructae]|uniref:hypothetical protein n=1 Tax=Flavobacterium tructae TaxID=1114873 RepID=UPI002551EFC3|nr:hypothetical protein [Flavobacterium tructae]MDL2141268.1 hypothetical protein [Flavobacterium tructae]
MSANHFSKEIETRLIEFFVNSIDPKDMARSIRRVNYTLSLSSMRGCETIESELPYIDDNFYWLNKLAEILDPYLDVE